LKVAAASFLQGLTAHYLTDTSYNIKRGDYVLVHAAAGGTGSLIVQMAKLRGGIVIGTVGSQAKAEIARAAGCDYVILYNEVDFLEEVRKIVPAGVRAVYDGVGLTTYEKSMKCLGKIGTLVLFGNASGAVPPINPLALTSHGSIFLARPTLNDHIATREAFLSRSNELFQWIQKNTVHVSIGQMLTLEEAAEAHRIVESRKVSGKVILEIVKE
jgi:NADPH2:quinone reductase